MAKKRITISIEEKILKRIEKDIEEVPVGKLPRRSRSSFIEWLIGKKLDEE